MLAELSRVLRPGGRLCHNFCERAFMQSLPFTGYGFTLYDAADIRRLAETLPLCCVREVRSQDWAVSKSGKLVRRGFVDLVFEKAAA